MKTYSAILFIAALALSSCGTAYQAGQTPDAVYYSPEEEQQPVPTASSNADQYVVNTDSEEGNYVVYQDGAGYNDYSYYDDGYYSRRIHMFDRPGGLFSYNYYMMNNPWYGGSPYLWNSFAYNSFGWYHNPYMWSPGLSFGLSWGLPYAYGGWYNPYRPYYGYGYGYGYMPGYYYGGYGYGYGKYLISNPRPAVSYGPRRSVGSRAANTNPSNRVSRAGQSANAPRVSRTSSERVQGDNNTRATRRSFRQGENERTVRTDNRRRTSTSSRSERRIFRQRADERPVRVNQQRSTTRQQQRAVRPQRTTRRVYQQPRNTSTSRPQRTDRKSVV